VARVEIRHLGKDVPGKSGAPVRILGDVSLEIADGEFLVLVGPSGCGKTTLLRCIAGLETASRGDLFLDEDRVTDWEPGARDIAMVFQSYALYPHLSVRENLAFGLKMRRTPPDEIERRVREAAALLQIESYLDRRPAALSGGQRQRVAMGRAVVRRPRVFLFDEPLSNLDASLRGQMRVELKRLHARLSATMIYVTHDQVEAMTLADRIAVLRAGSLEQVGTPRELYERPRNLFVARFIGTPEMNAIRGTIAAGQFAAPGMALAIEGLPDGEATLGVRAEDILVENAARGGDALAIVDVVENLVWESMLHLAVDKNTLCARVESARAPNPGDRVALRFARERLHWFSSSEARLEPQVARAIAG
jgi:sn-glycerol 3-phosphate transport system ATP-binding protein